ncbi:MAG TPA: DUF1684 domain-containing protein [Pyrinomonadaceae bacterium]|jgi:hypothetical protein
MKSFIFTISILLCLAGFIRAQTYYGTDDIKIFREGREKDFRNPQMSPLPPADVAKFQGLNYFPVDAGFRVKAEFIKTPEEKYFMMPTSTGTAHKYIKVGALSFKLSGKDYVLNAYQSERILNDPKFQEYKSSLFIPFRDATSGKETYGGGRYIHIAMPKDKETILDFNLAFNPSCAYGDPHFSCPIPPKENFLPIEVKAGEKNYLVKKENTGEKN